MYIQAIQSSSSSTSHMPSIAILVNAYLGMLFYPPSLFLAGAKLDQVCLAHALLRPDLV